ncbi:hypothetical protein J3R82DRAFT_10366 [Butyriboletus roseoflavus]|nr:hypothetical protein J3R82DRAFT_10366 [Butyriboletus roseoflavus]
MFTGKHPRVLAAAIVQFSLSTAHVIVSLVKLLQAFAKGVDPDVYYSNPSANSIFVVGFYIYVINTYVQELLLMWRLYGLWGHNIKVCIIPSIFWVAHVCIATIAISSFIPNTATASPRNVFVFGLAGWGLETATNLAANFGIAYRLWKAGRRTAPLGAQRHMNYQSTMLLIVECGALITTCTVIMFGLFASGYGSAIAGIGVAAQIATVSPLLIIVRVGLAQTRTCPSSRTTSTYPLEISVLRTENTFSECILQGARKPRGGSLRDGAKSDSEEAL